MWRNSPTFDPLNQELMITIFTNPRPFKEPFDRIQRNAISSWLHLNPQCEILLCEDEEGTTKNVARELGVGYIPQVKTTEFGTPLISDVFQKAQELASYDILAQINTDIILMNDFPSAVKSVQSLIESRPFLMVGRRWDLVVSELIDFDQQGNWKSIIHKNLLESGTLHGLSGMDYWVFKKGTLNPPGFVVGRPGIDSWLVYEARRQQIHVIDATPSVKIIHQSHNYPNQAKDYFRIEKKRNQKLSGKFQSFSLRDATFLLDKNRLIQPPFPRNLIHKVSLWKTWQLLLFTKRTLRRIISKIL